MKYQPYNKFNFQVEFDSGPTPFEPFEFVDKRDVPPPEPIDDYKPVPPPPPPMATEGDDIIFLGNGDDTFDALGGNDQVFGGSGEDLLIGGDGDDQLFGDGWNDNLEGGAGVDELTGGDGTDFFIFHEGDSGVGDQADKIMDYAQYDYLSFMHIDGDKTQAGDQHFTWVGEIGAGGEPGIAEIGFYFDGADSRLVLNNGDIFEIVLINTHDVPYGNMYNVDMNDGYGPLFAMPGNDDPTSFASDFSIL